MSKLNSMPINPKILTYEDEDNYNAQLQLKIKKQLKAIQVIKGSYDKLKMESKIKGNSRFSSASYTSNAYNELNTSSLKGNEIINENVYNNSKNRDSVNKPINKNNDILNGKPNSTSATPFQSTNQSTNGNLNNKKQCFNNSMELNSTEEIKLYEKDNEKEKSTMVKNKKTLSQDCQENLDFKLFLNGIIILKYR